jgi:hypothetical protein
MAGNKGGIGIRLDFYDTSLCFIVSHLAAGMIFFSRKIKMLYTVD